MKRHDPVLQVRAQARGGGKEQDFLVPLDGRGKGGGVDHHERTEEKR
jgi:hypothetical protein